MANFTKEEISKATVIYDNLHKTFEDIAKDSSAIRNLKKQVSYILDKGDNQTILTGNIVGPRFLINDRDYENLFNAMTLDINNVREVYMSSPYAQSMSAGLEAYRAASNKSFSYSVDSGRHTQHILGIPFVMLSEELYKLGKKEDSLFVYWVGFLRAYASAVRSSFKYWNAGDGDIMLGIIEKHPKFTSKYDLKKEGSISGVLTKSARTSWEHYISALTNRPADQYICNDVIYSGVYSRTSSWIKSVAALFYEVKSSPSASKYYLKYESSSALGEDDNGDEISYDVEIASISSFKTSLIRKASMKLNTSGLDDRLITLAIFSVCYKEGSNVSIEKDGQNSKSITQLYGPATAYFGIVKTALGEIIDNRRKDLELYMTSIVDSFYLNLDQNGNRRVPKDIRQYEKFIPACKAIFKSPNSSDPNILRVRKMTTDFLQSLSSYYQTHQNEGTRLKIKMSVFMYFVWFIYTTAKNI